jgi:hypothetical protein
VVELALLLLELLPHAASKTDAASVGRRNLIDCRMCGLLTGESATTPAATK